jgi:uncharacterized protein
MPVTPTYPGIYIEELPSSARTITAAPTSIAVFVGYTHPFKTKNFNQAVRIFNFTEYEREFGGFFSSSRIKDDVSNAVNQFFLNGGSDTYVVGLSPHYIETTVSGEIDHGAVKNPFIVPTGSNIRFTGLEPIDATEMAITISNRRQTRAANDTADITIAYGSRAETFRGVTLSTDPDDKENYLSNRINGISALVTVSAEPPPVSLAAPNFGAAFPNLTSPILLAHNPAPATVWGSFRTSDFRNVFQQDGSLDKVSIFNLLVIPGIADNSIWSTALAFCERKQAFLILDPPGQAVADRTSVPSGGSDDDFLMGNLMTKTSSPIPKSTNGAIYFPYLKSTNPLTGNPIELPPSGFVAGIYARTDLNRGVWKAPAGLETTLLNTTGVVESGRMTDQRQGTLNPIGVNCLRSFPGVGTVVYGARTLVGSDTNTSFQQWKYVPVRRIALFIEQTLIRNLGWVVFEPNDEPLWAAIRTSIEGFMLSLFSQGAFQGSTPSQAFQVKCDKSTTTQTDIDLGKVNIVVAFAPLKPAEFVIIKIAQLAGQVQA